MQIRYFFFLILLIPVTGCSLFRSEKNQNPVEPQRFYYSSSSITTKVGYLHGKDTVIAPVYDDGLNFHKDLAPVSQNGKWFYIDTTGTPINDLQFDLASEFTDSTGYALKNKMVYRVYPDGSAIPNCQDVSIPESDQHTENDLAGQKEQENDTINALVEVEPIFPGGMDELHKFLRNNINYPYQARQNNQEGRVMITFVVEKDGCLSNIEIKDQFEQTRHSLLHEAALRTIITMPKWEPGTQQGQPVRVRVNLPITFRLH